MAGCIPVNAPTAIKWLKDTIYTEEMAAKVWVRISFDDKILCRLIEIKFNSKFPFPQTLDGRRVTTETRIQGETVIYRAVVWCKISDLLEGELPGSSFDLYDFVM